MYTNFSGVIKSLRGTDVHPRNSDEIITHVQTAAKNNTIIRVVGNGCSFNTLAHADDAMRIHLTTFMNNIVCVHDCCVTVEAGMKLFDLCECLAANYGLALSNIPNYGNMTVGGVVATGVHGTTGKLQRDTLSSSIVDLAMVNGSGVIAHLGANESITLGMLGVVYNVTLRTVPLYYVDHFAKNVINTSSLQQLALVDLTKYDWVMYKFLVGSMSLSLIRETFDTITKPAFTDFMETPWVVHNAFATLWDNTKTLGKYFFPANDFATNLPHKEFFFTEFCKRNHYAMYHRAMMGPQFICAHAELEWCLDLKHLDSALADITLHLETSRDKFFKQPIECHIRFSPPDSALGHCAAASGGEMKVWINLNVRQHLHMASLSFEPIEQILMRYDAIPHWSKCWSGLDLLLEYVARKQSTFLDNLKKLSQKHDPRHLFKHRNIST